MRLIIVHNSEACGKLLLQQLKQRGPNRAQQMNVCIINRVTKDHFYLPCLGFLSLLVCVKYLQSVKEYLKTVFKEI